ncbi:hypothetical protein [Halomonas salina]|uniref:hypothetical protein n=1 Tax=Halomonas salina TaxID=42565 RepID=UPI00126827F7|nr:hypothetical protein [Halomonas salina]
MKPSVSRKCKNPDCEEYDKEVLLVQEEDKWFYASPFCDNCHHEGSLRWSHKGIEANDDKSFYAIVNGRAKEFHLLRKLIEKGVADADDIARHKEILGQIEDLECTGCGQKLIHHEH